MEINAEHSDTITKWKTPYIVDYIVKGKYLGTDHINDVLNCWLRIMSYTEDKNELLGLRRILLISF